jgi:hypothetical protein
MLKLQMLMKYLKENLNKELCPIHELIERLSIAKIVVFPKVTTIPIRIAGEFFFNSCQLMVIATKDCKTYTGKQIELL